VFSVFCSNLFFSGSDYFRIATIRRNRLSGTPVATLDVCTIDATAQVFHTPYGVARGGPVGGGNPRLSVTGGSGRNHGRTKVSCELLLWQTHVAAIFWYRGSDANGWK